MITFVGVIDLFHTYRQNKKSYLEIFRKAIQIILYDGLTPELAAKCYRCHIYVRKSSFKQAQKKAKSFFRGNKGNGSTGNNNNNNNSNSNSNSSNGSNGDTSGRTLAFWCFSPSVAMSQLIRLGVRSIVLTSGTLSPMDSFAKEMRLPFNVRLQNSHVITNEQINW